MKIVEIYRLQNNGDQRLAATCKLTGQTAQCDGDEMLTKNLTEQGIRNYSDASGEKKLFPSDGIKFLENLKWAFKSAYLTASDIKESENR